MRKPRDAYTLVEVIVAVVIFQVGFLGAASMLFVAAHEFDRAKEIEDAVSATLAVVDAMPSELGTGLQRHQYPWGDVQVVISGTGEVTIVATATRGDTLSSATTFWPVTP